MMVDQLMVPPGEREDGDKVNALNASEPELLIMAANYLADVRVHPRIVEAVRRACRRLLDGREGNGDA